MCGQCGDLGEYPENSDAGAVVADVDFGVLIGATMFADGAVAGVDESVQAAAQMSAASAMRDTRIDESPVHGNPTGMARSLGAVASLALRPRLSTGLPLSRALGPTILPRSGRAVGDRQPRAIPSYRIDACRGDARRDRRWRDDL